MHMSVILDLRVKDELLLIERFSHRFLRFL